MNETLRDIAPLFEEMDKLLHAFKKDTYEETFKDYMQKNGEYFKELNRMLASEENSGFADEYADIVINFAESVIQSMNGKVKKENCQINYNMFMAVYFMPAVLEGRQAGAQPLLDSICKKWSERFKGQNIKGAEFAAICSGFKSKLCYVTTAVCRSLHKPEDCYELELLRDYRDNYLLNNGEAALVEKYYDIAPTIVKRIDKLADADEKYRYIWENYLKPCVAAIESGRLEECKEAYIDMVEELQEQYMITAENKKKQIDWHERRQH